MKLNYVQPRLTIGTPFRPMDYTDAYAVAFLPTRVQRGVGAAKSEARCNVAIFDTEDSDPRVVENVIVTHGDIFWALQRAHDANAVLVGYIGQGNETKYGTKPWAVRDLDPEDAERIAEKCEGVLA